MAVNIYIYIYIYLLCCLFCFFFSRGEEEKQMDAPDRGLRKGSEGCSGSSVRGGGERWVRIFPPGIGPRVKKSSLFPFTGACGHFGETPEFWPTAISGLPVFGSPAKSD